MLGFAALGCAGTLDILLPGPVGDQQQPRDGFFRLQTALARKTAEDATPKPAQNSLETENEELRQENEKLRAGRETQKRKAKRKEKREKAKREAQAKRRRGRIYHRRLFVLRRNALAAGSRPLLPRTYRVLC